MILLDSNIIIYSALPEYDYLHEYYEKRDSFASEISTLEVLGFSKITKEQETFFGTIFSTINVLPITSEIIEQAISFRKRYSLSIGDAIIASTAFVNDLMLLTNNVADYKKIKEITLKDPIKEH
jgi:hypothetical protein